MDGWMDGWTDGWLRGWGWPDSESVQKTKIHECKLKCYSSHFSNSHGDRKENYSTTKLCFGGIVAMGCLPLLDANTIVSEPSALPEHPNDAMFVQQWVARSGLGAYKGGQLQARSMVR